MIRDISTVPLNRLRKRELRALIVQMRLRHNRDIQSLLAELPPETAAAWCLRQVRRKPSAVTLEAVSPTGRADG